MTRPTKPGPIHVRRRCPDCGSSLVKRSSESKHPLMSSTFLVCKNIVCGATFAGYDEITHRLSPPSTPNPEINLPYASTAIRRGVLEHLGITPPPPVEDASEGAGGAHV
ncbi:ogr/Delta-like zinc finger family protein [Pseudomonas yamanorum]|nr:ogr/Delta-like zinc finger family protein [Pseudomonas yamanorum]